MIGHGSGWTRPCQYEHGSEAGPDSNMSRGKMASTGKIGHHYSFSQEKHFDLACHLTDRIDVVLSFRLQRMPCS